MKNGHIGYGHNSELSLLTSLIATSIHKNSKLTPEERKAKEDIQKEREEQERVSRSVQQGKCPYCNSKLIRGKKDKCNNHLRTWTCLECDSKFTR